MPALSALKCSGDRAVGLVGGDEDLVGVFEAEWFQIDEDAMLVGHGQGDPLDLGARVERRRRPSRGASAARRGSVAGEGLEQGLANLGVGAIPIERSLGDV